MRRTFSSCKFFMLHQIFKSNSIKKRPLSMKKFLPIILVSLISGFAFSQTALHSFESHLQPTVQGLTQSQIELYISKGNFEPYRLQDKRTTLTFDNGFEIILLSANEAERIGLISNASSYQVDFPKTYKIPVFHMSPQGFVVAAYPANPKSKKK